MVNPGRDEHEEQNEIKDLIGKMIVLDMKCSLIYLGRLEEWGPHFVTLSNVDVHDVSQGSSNKDVYAITARKHGIQVNRRRVIVRKDEVVSLSDLADVIDF